MHTWKPFILLAIAIFLFQCAVGVAMLLLIPDWTHRGTFGDMFGAVNALFSGLAFAGIIYTITLQRQELSLQREELALTRNELARTAVAQEKSELALAAQAQAATVSARLSAANYLYSEAEKTIASINSWTQGSPEGVRKESAVQEKQKLLADIRNLYKRLSEIDETHA
jgi:hypothetical protein